MVSCPGAEDDDACTPGAENSPLDELVALLERDPGQGQAALEGLESLEPTTRLAIIDGLGGVSPGQGVLNLLRLLEASDDESTREAAKAALDRITGRSSSNSPPDEARRGDIVIVG